MNVTQTAAQILLSHNPGLNQMRSRPQEKIYSVVILITVSHEGLAFRKDLGLSPRCRILELPLLTLL